MLALRCYPPGAAHGDGGSTKRSCSSVGSCDCCEGGLFTTSSGSVCAARGVRAHIHHF